MAVLISLQCPNCGGLLELTSRADLFKCAHCRHLAILRWTEVESAPPHATELREKKSWKANLLRPGDALSWQGGELCMTETELAFVPHALNFGPLEQAVLPLASIASIELQKGLVSDELTITDQRARRWGLRVWRGAEVQAEIEAARAR